MASRQLVASIFLWWMVVALKLSTAHGYRSAEATSRLTPNRHRPPLNTAAEDSTFDYIRPCYFTSWSQYRQGGAKYTPEDYVPGLCTHILYAFASIDESNFTIVPFDENDVSNEWSKIGMFERVNRLKKIDPQLKTLISIGGWSFGTKIFQQTSSNETNRSKFISSAIDFVRFHNFDGIDIDWEYPNGTEDINSFTLLMKELRRAISTECLDTTRKDRLLLTVAVSASRKTIKTGYNIPELAKYVDFVLLMSYDFHGAWETTTNLHNALYMERWMNDEQRVLNVDWAANYWALKGMPRRKIIIGIPTYGRGWTLNSTKPSSCHIGLYAASPSNATKFVVESGVAAYYEICEMLTKGAKRCWDAEGAVPYLVYENQWFTYDDVESIQRKMAYLKRQLFGGAFVWTLDFDDFNGLCDTHRNDTYPLIRTIVRELSGRDINTLKNVNRTCHRKSGKESVNSTTLPTPAYKNSLVDRCETDGFFPNIEDCHSFYRCAGGISYSFVCPTGLAFNRSTLLCDHLTNTKCPGNSTRLPRRRQPS